MITVANNIENIEVIYDVCVMTARDLTERLCRQLAKHHSYRICLIHSGFFFASLIVSEGFCEMSVKFPRTTRSYIPGDIIFRSPLSDLRIQMPHRLR
jgi:hypothetical protein